MPRPKVKPFVIGRKFTRLTIVEVLFDRRRYYKCKCICGNIVYPVHSALRHGKAKSCGCYKNDMVVARNKAYAISDSTRSINGKRTSTFLAWRNMIARCEDRDHKSYRRYGGRGIRVCNRWLFSFDDFVEDMGEKPLKGLQLDRINNDKHYTPKNCRWTTSRINCNNTSRNRPIKFRGQTKNLKQWAKEYGMSHQAVRHRIHAGWSLEDVFTYPVAHANRWRHVK